jgi:hypothetical protein
MYETCNILKYSNHVYVDYTYSAGAVTEKSKVVTCMPRRRMGALT